MRVLAVIALAMLLAGCEGDRIKQSKNAPVIVAGRHGEVRHRGRPQEPVSDLVTHI